MRIKQLFLYLTIGTFVSSCNEIKEKIGGGFSKNIISENTQLNCDYNNLSNQFNVKFVINKDPKKTTSAVDYAVQILDKNNKVLKTIVSQPNISNDELDKFKICDQVKSLATKYNLAKSFDIESFDGNVVVGDFNFDGKDDFAVYNRKQDNKAYYNYYLQDGKGEFNIDNFLSDDTDYFSKKYDVNGKTIVIQDKSTIKKYAYKNGSWTMTEEVNDPFPNVTKLGVLVPNINNNNNKDYYFYFPLKGLTIYDNNFKAVGNIIINKEKLTFNFIINGNINNKWNSIEILYELPLIYYTSKNGLYLKLDMPGEYYLSSIELKSKQIKPMNLIDYIVDNDKGNLETNGITMNVRQAPTANSTLISQLSPGVPYSFEFTGNKKGDWAEVSVINVKDIDNYEDIYHTGKGWVKLISDDGHLNFYNWNL